MNSAKELDNFIISNPHKRNLTISDLWIDIPANTYSLDLKKRATLVQLEGSEGIKIAIDNHYIYPASKCPLPRGSSSFRNLMRKVGSDETLNVRLERKLGGVGDVLFNSVVAKAIKINYPKAKITYAVTYDYYGGTLKILAEHNPYIDRVVNCKIEDSEVYDLCIDITSAEMNYEARHQPKITKSRIELHLAHAGIWCEDRKPVYCVTDEEHRIAIDWLKEREILGKKLIGFELRSNAENRNWPIDYYKELANKLLEKKNTAVILFDHIKNSLEWNQERVYHCIGEKIELVAALMEECDCFIAPDSGLLHLAGALDISVIGIFGQIDGLCRTKEYSKAQVIQLKEPKCIPCWYRPKPGCKRECLSNITPKMVWERVYSIL